MGRIAQLGIALGSLGAILALMGLFPGVTGITPTGGIGIVQIIAILMGFALLIFGALIYAKFTFYEHNTSTLTQQIGTRLAMTGLLFASMSGLADIMGFGSHIPSTAQDVFFGEWQALGMIGNFIIASLGVLIYTIAGQSDT